MVPIHVPPLKGIAIQAFSAPDIMPTAALASYFDRFGFCPARVSDLPEPGLGCVVVIPCFNEPDLRSALDALDRCACPSRPVEILVVINAAAGSPRDVVDRNAAAAAIVRDWKARGSPPVLRVHAIDVTDLPPKHAGVGLARKIGMDEALRRFDAAGTGEREGVIACFDADCDCDPNYLTALEDHFRAHPDTPGCSIYFEHPLEGPCASLPYDAVAAYELHLRYFVGGLRHAGIPFAYHTVGSSMAVTAEAYRKAGGMNRRKAGEDFYFLHKIIALGRFTELNTTRVLPSPRPSDRVPFGTGRAVRAYLDSGGQPSYPMRAFEDLRWFTAWTNAQAGIRADNPDTRASEDSPGANREGPVPRSFPSDCPPLLAEFLREQHFADAWSLLRGQTASAAAFRRRLYHWFDAFRAMKYIHYARDNGYGAPPVAQAAGDLLHRIEPAFDLSAPEDPRGVRRLLARYRIRDRDESWDWKRT